MTFHASIRSRSGESKAARPGPEARAAAAVAPAAAGGRDVPPSGAADPGRHAEGLNAQQAAAVLHDLDRDGPVLVLAGAGSGKTTVLARRVARQASLDGGGEGILALTFTKEAAEEMRGRVAALLRAAGPATGASGTGTGIPGGPAFATFHAFAYALVRKDGHWERLGFARRPALLEPSAQSEWLERARRELGLEEPPEALVARLARPFGEPLPGGPDDLRDRFRRHLLEAGCVAFDDMVALAIRLLRDHPDVLADTRARIRRVLVDEFQDTSPDQLELVRLVLGDRPGLFLVGDDDQSIYGFRGADPGNIAKAGALFPGLRLLKLETNYRSTPPIVAYANAIFRGKPAPLRKVLKAGRPLPPGARPAPVRILEHADGPAQGAWMVGEMRRLIREEGLGWGGMAVLYRLNALEPYYRSLLAALAGPEAAASVVLATIHASKGLQYPAVFLVGLEDGVLPYRRPGAAEDPQRLAEERRIFYVGVTRAERFLFLCHCRRRMQRGRLRDQRRSPFLRGPAAWRGWRALGRRVMGFWTRGGSAQA